jgi:hypothetical protein
MPDTPRWPVDLQAHTACSDGSDAPADLVARAARLGLRVLAITDHDTVLGLGEALAAGTTLGVEVVPGLEFSTRHELARDYADINILAYGFRLDDPGLRQVLAEVAASRLDQKVRQIEKLQAHGIDVSVDEVLALAGGVPGRVHIAQVALARNPHRFASIGDVFDQYLAADAPNSTYVTRRFSLTVEDAIDVTHAACGTAVLAHPGLYPRVRDVDGVIRRLAQAGLDGLEVNYPYVEARSKATPAAARRLVAHFGALAAELGLLQTGGSDYHGAAKPAIELGQAGLSDEAWRALRPQLLRPHGSCAP